MQRPPPSRLPYPTAITFASVALLASVARSEEPQAAGAPRARPQPPPLSASAEAARPFLLDKERIAEETHAKVRGLREADNPHIRRGLLIRKLQDDPARREVDTESLRASWIASIERRAAEKRQAPAPSSPAEELEAERQPAATIARSDDGSEDPRSSTLAWVAASTLVAAALLLVIVHWIR